MCIRDRICLFLGKEDLNNYIQDRFHGTEEIETDDDLTVDAEEKDLILDYCKAYFDALIDLPNICLLYTSRCV